MLLADNQVTRFWKALEEVLASGSLTPEQEQLIAEDQLLERLTWPLRWTWLALLSLQVRDAHGLTFASRRAIAQRRRRFHSCGSSEAAVKRHIKALQREGVILRFVEQRPGEHHRVRKVHVTVGLFPDRHGHRMGLSPEARKLVHSWGSTWWEADPRAYFFGPLLKDSGRRRGIRRRIYFEDLVAADGDAACRAALGQGPPLSVGHFASELTHRKKKGPDARAPGNQSPDPGTRHQNRASAGLYQTSEPLGRPVAPGDLADGGDHLGAARDAGYPVPGLCAHRRPEGGTLGHPRPQGGISGLSTPAAGRRS